MYLNVDSYEAGLYDEENGYYISPAPINDMELTEEEIQDQRLSKDHQKEFDN